MKIREELYNVYESTRLCKIQVYELQINSTKRSSLCFLQEKP